MMAISSTRHRGLSFQQKDKLYGYLFAAPQVLGFLLFVLGPLIAVLVFSLQDRNLLTGQVTYIGLQNYDMMLNRDPFFWKVLRNSLVFSVGLVPLNLTLALTLAILLTRPFRGAVFFRTLFFAPVITSAVAWAVVWKFLLQDNVGVNSFLAMLGIEGPNWLFDQNWAMVAVIVVQVVKNVGLNALIFMAALQNIPRSYTEAAEVDGANLWQRIRRITLPLLTPTIMLVLLITLVGSLRVFDTIMLLTAGGPANATNVLVYYVYFNAFKIFRVGYAGSLAVVLFSIAFIATIIQWVVRRKVSYNER